MAIEDADTTTAASDMPIAEGLRLLPNAPEVTSVKSLANTERVVQTMVFEMSRRFNAEEEAASTRMHQMIQGRACTARGSVQKGFRWEC